MVKQLTIEEFKNSIYDFEKNPDKWVYEGSKPAIIDFYADWCGPCQMVAPILEELSNEYENKIDIYKVDTEKEQELSAILGIRSLPSILFIPLNEDPQMSIGALPKTAFEEAIKNILKV